MPCTVALVNASISCPEPHILIGHDQMRLLHVYYLGTPASTIGSMIVHITQYTLVQTKTPQHVCVLTGSECKCIIISANKGHNVGIYICIYSSGASVMKDYGAGKRCSESIVCTHVLSVVKISCAM